MDEILTLDLPAFLTAALAALCCSVMGNFLMLRQQSMMGDALSHCVLPGLVIGYLLSGTLSSVAMLGGAAFSCLLAVLCIRGLEVYGRVYSGAAMAIVLSVFFAGGVFLLETRVGGRVHLDTDHALYGALELSYWPDAPDLGTLPASVKMLFALALLIAAAVFVFFKELRLSLFDPEFASVAGFRPSLVSTLVLSAVAMTLVACFDAVGVILVIALLICPAACARMFCDDLKCQILLSALTGVTGAVLGYILAAKAPLWLGFEHSLSAAGMIALTLGAFQTGAMLFSPAYGAFRCE